MIPSHPFPYEIPLFSGHRLMRNDELWGSTDSRDLSPELEHNDEHYTNKKHETWRK